MSRAAAHERFVLDASVALGAFFEDEQDAYSVAVWESIDQVRPTVPWLWHLELANILSRAASRGRITNEAVHDSWRRLEAVGLITLESERAMSHWLRCAGDWGLSAYDCVYLDLALRLKAPLASKDRDLIQAARRIGVELHLPNKLDLA
jgi:predicted nucleic acid-binding protein